MFNSPSSITRARSTTFRFSADPQKIFQILPRAQDCKAIQSCFFSFSACMHQFQYVICLLLKASQVYECEKVGFVLMKTFFSYHHSICGGFKGNIPEIIVQEECAFLHVWWLPLSFLQPASASCSIVDDKRSGGCNDN